MGNCTQRCFILVLVVMLFQCLIDASASSVNVSTGTRILATPLRVSLYTPLHFPPSQDVYGLDLGVVDSEALHVNGLQASLLFAEIDNTAYGVQVAGFMSMAHSFTGLQCSVLGGYADSLTGIQAGIITYSSDHYYGIQAGLINLCGNGYGIQAGTVNAAGPFCGIQVGLINSAANITGVQIGLINLVGRSHIERIVPFFNCGW